MSSADDDARRDRLTHRALAAYWRYEPHPRPPRTAEVETHDGREYVVLRDAAGVLVVYRVRTYDGQLRRLRRWPATLRIHGDREDPDANPQPHHPVPTRATMTEPSPFPEPGDPDLDLDIDGAVIVSLVRHEYAFIIVARGGHARRWDADAGALVDAGTMGDGEITFEFAPGPYAEITAAATEVKLSVWRDHATPLRIVSAPGRPTMLYDPSDMSLPIPRKNG